MCVHVKIFQCAQGNRAICRLMSAAFRILGTNPASPVCISIPHAGRAYPHDIEALLAVPLARVRALEDRHVDAFGPLLARRGHATIIASTPRLLIDLNRSETDIDPATMVASYMPSYRPSLRARGGLGLVPDRLAGSGRLWRFALDAKTLTHRITELHRPYHAALATLLARARSVHGRAVLIDLHSMPPLPGPDAADVVIGDGHGRSASHGVIAEARAAFEQAGLRVAYNQPYAGGHILERHGGRDHGVDAIQIELDRRLYLDTKLDLPTTGVRRIGTILGDLADRLAASSQRQDWPIAAE